MICPACGRQASHHTVEKYQYRESGLDNVFVTGAEIFRCECGQEYVQLPGAQEIHDQVASGVLNKFSLLTGPEAKFLRKWLRLTSEEMAKALGYTRVSVSRWENRGLSAATDRALRLYASAVRNVPINFEMLFSSISAKPQKSFRIVVGGVKAADAYTSASPIVSAGSSMQEPLANFDGPIAMSGEAAKASNQELALAA